MRFGASAALSSLRAYSRILMAFYLRNRGSLFPVIRVCAACHPQRSQACCRPPFFLTQSGESNATWDVVKTLRLFVPPPFWNLQRYFSACCEWQDPGPPTRLRVLFLFWRLILAFNSGKHPSSLINARLLMPRALHKDEVTSLNALVLGFFLSSFVRISEGLSLNLLEQKPPDTGILLAILAHNTNLLVIDWTFTKRVPLTQCN